MYHEVLSLKALESWIVRQSVNDLGPLGTYWLCHKCDEAKNYFEDVENWV